MTSDQLALVQAKAFVISVDAPTPVRLAVTAHLPSRANALGVVIVTGGQQIRAGSHRQFLKLARRVAQDGYACLRFDLPGLGDSEGETGTFDGNDIILSAVIDAFLQRAPTVRRVVLWGLCDGATAAALYAQRDSRVAGLVLANPWVRTEQVQAQALVKTYYRQRFVSPLFWGKLLRGKVGVMRSAKEWLDNWRAARSVANTHAADLPGRLRKALNDFPGPIEIIIAEQDLTGQEFLLIAQGLAARPSICISRVDGADHTFSTRAWHEQLESLSLQLLAKVLSVN